MTVNETTMIDDGHPSPLPAEAADGENGDSRRSADALQQVVYSVSHDLQAPARHIQAFSELLQQQLGDRLDPVAAGYVDHLITASGALKGKLDGMTRFSRAISGPHHRQWCDVESAVDEAAALVGERLAGAGATIEPAPLPSVMADRDQLVAALAELLDNSAKFAVEPVTIRISAQPGTTTHTFSVSDDGPGFRRTPAENAVKLFKRFHNPSTPGEGVGLTIVEQVIERHGGVLSVGNLPEGGARVGFSLPAVEPVGPPADGSGR